MTGRLQIFRAEWVLPVSSPPIHRGEVLVGTDGMIAAVAPEGALERPEHASVHDLGSAILLPGLVNVHAHPELAMFRGALEDLPFRDWILRLVAAKRISLNDDDALAAARWTAIESIASGITTTAATEASGAAAIALGEAGLRGIVYQEVFGPDPDQVGDALCQLRADLERLRSHGGDRVQIGVSPHAPFTVSDELYRSVTRLALDEGYPVATHIAESKAERDLVVRGDGDFAAGLRARGISTVPRARTPIDLLARLGVLEARPLLIHCVDLDDEDIATIAESGSAVAHCPIANAKLGHGLAPIGVLREAGVTVGLGTDSVGSNNRLDLLEEGRVAALLQRARTRDPMAFRADELLRMATIEGARALGMEARIGTLEPGKEADLCAVALHSPSTVPHFEPEATLFHAARASDVVLTAVGGEILYSRGEFQHLDPAAVRRDIESAAARLRAAS